MKPELVCFISDCGEYGVIKKPNNINGSQYQICRVTMLDDSGVSLDSIPRDSPESFLDLEDLFCEVPKGLL